MEDANLDLVQTISELEIEMLKASADVQFEKATLLKVYCFVKGTRRYVC